MLITFEGLDLCGKTTQANLLVEKLTMMQHSVQFIREPGGTLISERIRDMLLDKTCSEMTDLAELFLFSASRTQVVSEVLLPSLRAGKIVVCDRYYDSTTAYQGYGRRLDLEAVRNINSIATLATKPDITVLVDIPVDEISKRKAKAGIAFDRMESSGKEFYNRVREGYLDIARREHARFITVDGTAPIGDVAQTIWRAIEGKLPSKEPLRENIQSLGAGEERS
jgi:dTMP kinase